MASHRNWMIAISLALALSPIAGCETTDNPNEGGLVGGLHGLFSGAYEDRLHAQQAQLGSAQLQEQYLASNNMQLGQQASTAAAQRTRLRQQVRALEVRTQELTARTSQLQADTAAKRQERDDFDKRLRQFRADVAQLGRDVDASKKSAEEAERERRALEAELKDLTVVADALR